MTNFQEISLSQITPSPLNPRRGHPISAETRQKISAAMQGKRNALGTTRSEETKARLRAIRTGRKLSGTSRAKISEVLRGNKYHLGKKMSAEARAKISMRHKGKRTGAESHRWKGGRFIDKDGYIRVHRPDHPAADSRGYVLEHRLVMESMLGRPLLSAEVVHHEDKNRTNNAPANLRLFPSQADHKDYHAKGER